MKLDRRTFLYLSLAAGATALLPSGARLLNLKPNIRTQRQSRFLVVYMRGGSDNFSLMPPIEDPFYYSARPNLALKKSETISIDPLFSIHKEFSSLMPAWNERELLFINQFGFPFVGRSHFFSQDVLESGGLDLSKQGSGLLSRALHLKMEQKTPLMAGVSIQTTLPLSLRGPYNGISVNSLDLFSTTQTTGNISAFRRILKSSNEELSNIQTVYEKLSEAGEAKIVNNFPSTSFGSQMRDIAKVFLTHPESIVAVAESFNWDLHSGGKPQAGNRFAENVKELSEGLSTFRAEMIKQNIWDDTIILVMTEFGRTLHENSGQGTEHGYGGLALLLGGKLRDKQRGGKILHQWKELSPSTLFEQRDLSVVYDFRDVLGEIFTSHFQLEQSKVAELFFGYLPKKLDILG